MDREEVLRRSRAQLVLLRVRAQGECEVEIVPVGPLWLGSHWVDRRQILCTAGTDTPCELCGRSMSRVTGFVLAVVTQLERKRLMLLELSPLSWSGFEMSSQYEGVALDRGVITRLSRSSARKPLRMEVVRAGGPLASVSELEARLVNAVAVLFGIPLTQGSESIEEWRDRVTPFVARLAAIGAAKLKA